MAIKIGEVLHSRYRVDTRLAQGGFGTLYKSWDLSLERTCVLKENISESADAQRQFMREAKFLSNLSHPNLPRVTDYFLGVLGEQFLVMDYVEGQDLQDLLEEQGKPYPEDTAVGWVRQICDALNYLHSQKPAIIHRDIKPANIRISLSNTAILVDFGIAKVLDARVKTTLGARAVSPGFSPYEQYGKGNTDKRTDIYALGATLYTLLTAQEPPESIQRVVNDPLVPPRQINPNLSIRTSAAIVRAMQMDPTMRFQTALELKQALSAPPPIRISPRTPAPVILSSQQNQTHRGIVTRPWMLISLVIFLMLIIAGLLVRIIGLYGTQAQISPTYNISNYQTISTKETQQFSALSAGTLSSTMNSTDLTPTLTPLVYIVQVGDTCSEIAMAYGLSIDNIVLANSDLEPDCGFLYAGQPLMIPQPEGPIETPIWIRSPTPDFGTVTQVSKIDGMVLVYIPAGEFTMGAEDTDRDARDNEKPSRDVYLDAYWIDETEITNEMYQKCVDQGKCAEPVEHHTISQVEYFRNPDYFNFPVVNISWDDARKYCQWAGRRLPSEAEWEKAARGEDERIFPWGTQSPSLKYANIAGLLGQLDTVGNYPSGMSPYGVLDMAGNAAEWVADWYLQDYYLDAPYKNPQGPPFGEFRIIRGGSWFNPEYASRATFRLWNYPFVLSDMIGFRCTMDE